MNNTVHLCAGTGLSLLYEWFNQFQPVLWWLYVNHAVHLCLGAGLNLLYEWLTSVNRVCDGYM